MTVTLRDIPGANKRYIEKNHEVCEKSYRQPNHQ